MMAVTSRSRNSIETPLTTSDDPKNALSDAAFRRTRVCVGGASTFGATVGRGTRGDSVAATSESRARGPAGCKADDKDDTNEDEGARPGERVLLVVRTDGERKDLQGQRRDRLA